MKYNIKCRIGHNSDMLQQMLKQPKLSHVDIVVKCKKYPDFYKELEEIGNAYDHDLNMSLYANLDKISEKKYFQLLDKGILFVNFYGYCMAKMTDDDYKKLYLLWIMKMDQQIRENPTRKYIITYFHSFCNNNDPFIFIRDVFKKLPIQYYALLDKIYVVEPNFSLRNSGVFEFGRLYKLYSRRLVYIETIQQFFKVQEVRQYGVYHHLPEILTLDVDQHTSTTPEKTYKEKQQEKAKQISMLMSAPPLAIKTNKQVKMDCLTVMLGDHKLDENGLPIYLVTLAATMRKHSDMLQMEGIFRKSGSIEEEELIIEELSKMDAASVLKETAEGPYCGYAVAGTIKKLLTKLEEPIVPYQTYNRIIQLDQIKPEEQLTIVKSIFYSLPVLNLRVIFFLIKFIRDQVLVHKCNKMNQYAMSVVLSPCLFRSKECTLQDLLKSGRFASIVNILFLKFEDIYNEELVKLQGDFQKRESQNSKEKKKNKSQKSIS